MFDVEFRIMCERIITCELTMNEFNRRLDTNGPEDALAYLKRAKRSVIQSKIPEIEEWYARTKSQKG